MTPSEAGFISNTAPPVTGYGIDYGYEHREALEKCDVCDGLYLPSRYEDHCNGMPHEAAFQALAKSLGL
ncbi:MAG: hypothetical protein ACXV2F_04865 [Halobacteriota archaeon]